jgi:hypothetical protein
MEENERPVNGFHPEAFAGLSALRLARERAVTERPEDASDRRVLTIVQPKLAARVSCLSKVRVRPKAQPAE